jgi:23S rRNA pseudouridine2457 synthase
VPLILLNKPFNVLSQFRDTCDRTTLAGLVRNRSVYPAGRLDYDSEGLLLLTDDGALQARISAARFRLAKTYWAQVEGTATALQAETLVAGVRLKDGPAVALTAQVIPEPTLLWTRQPPIRYRASIPTSWLELSIDAGRNRQVRRMTSAVGLPTLRLVRCRVGPWTLGSLRPGDSSTVSNEEAWRALREWDQEPF